MSNQVKPTAQISLAVNGLTAMRNNMCASGNTEAAEILEHFITALAWAAGYEPLGSKMSKGFEMCDSAITFGAEVIEAHLRRN